VPELTFVGTGYTYFQEYLPYVAQFQVRLGHVDFIGVGRMLLAYPEFPQHVLRGRALQRKLCRTFSDCTTGPRNRMVSGCYPLDPFYKSRPEAPIIHEIRRKAGRQPSAVGPLRRDQVEAADGTPSRRPGRNEGTPVQWASGGIRHQSLHCRPDVDTSLAR
jgi:hypothetical protein